MSNLFDRKRIITVPFPNGTGANQRGGYCDPLGNASNGINARATDDNPNGGMTIPLITKVLTGINIELVSKVAETREVRLFDNIGWHAANNTSFVNPTPEEVSISLGDYPNNQAALNAFYDSLTISNYKAFSIEVRSNNQMQLDKKLTYYIYNSDGSIALQDKIDPIFSVPDDRCDGRYMFKFSQELLLTGKLAFIYPILPDTTVNLLIHFEGAVNEM